MSGAFGLAVLTLTLIGADGANDLASPLPKVTKPRVSNDPEACETWLLSLRDAIRIGLDSSEIIRVLSLGDREPTVIARLNADGSVWRFKAELMAHVRSIEQVYWSLAQKHVQLRSSEKAVELTEEILKREESELEVGRGTVADVAESQQRLEQFRLDLVTRTSDVITTERQLRNILGLPPVDNRRIVPDTAPIEAHLEPDWDISLSTMMACQPDILLQEEMVRAAGARCLGACGVTMLALVLDPFEPIQSPLADFREAADSLRKQEVFLQQVVHQTTHSLARFFLEVDANYKQFKTASRLRTAAAQRLEAQRAFYEEGRITIDRYLDAVSQYASAVAQEAQFKTTYNISIVALEEAKGTLLAYDNIVLSEGSGRSGDDR